MGTTSLHFQSFERPFNIVVVQVEHIFVATSTACCHSWCRFFKASMLSQISLETSCKATVRFDFKSNKDKFAKLNFVHLFAYLGANFVDLINLRHHTIICHRFEASPNIHNYQVCWPWKFSQPSCCLWNSARPIWHLNGSSAMCQCSQVGPLVFRWKL